MIFFCGFTRLNLYIYWMRVRLYVQPGAKKTELSGTFNNMVKLRVAAPPVDGAANAEVVRFVASLLGLPKKGVILVNGEKSRTKTLEFDDVSVEDKKRIDELLIIKVEND